MCGGYLHIPQRLLADIMLSFCQLRLKFVHRCVSSTWPARLVNKSRPTTKGTHGQVGLHTDTTAPNPLPSSCLPSDFTSIISARYYEARRMSSAFLVAPCSEREYHGVGRRMWMTTATEPRRVHVITAGKCVMIFYNVVVIRTIPESSVRGYFRRCHCVRTYACALIG